MIQHSGHLNLSIFGRTDTNEQARFQTERFQNFLLEQLKTCDARNYTDIDLELSVVRGLFLLSFRVLLMNVFHNPSISLEINLD